MPMRVGGAFAALGLSLIGLAGVAAVPTLGASSSAVVQTGPAPQLGGFSARALGPDGEVTPQTYFELKLKPGESYDGDILVTNAAEDFVRLKVDSVDGLTGKTSGTVYANRTDPRTETSRWIKPKKAALRLDGKSSRKLAFHVHVPDDATPGDHVGAVAFQRILNPQKKGEFSVRQVLRVAVAVQIRVEGDAKAELGIGKIGIEALGGTQIPSVTVQLKNTGGLLCRPSLTVSLAKGDQALGTVSRQLDTILAGDTIDYPLQWNKPLDAGTYHADASTTGCGAPAKASADVTLKSDLTGSATSPGPDSAALADDPKGIPWWAFAIGIAAALGLGFLLARRTGRKDEPAPAAPAAPVAPAAAAPAAPEPTAPAAEAVEPPAPGGAVAIEPQDPPATPPTPPADGDAPTDQA